MTLGRLSSLASAVFLFATPLVSAQEDVPAQQDIGERLAKETERIAAELAKKGGLELPPLSPEHTDKQAPEIIRNAGEEYARAWQTYRKVTLWRPSENKPEPDAKEEKKINAANEREKFHSLLVRTIEANPPVDPAEYERFTYNDSSWCADGVITFGGRLAAGTALASLRQGQHFRALQILSQTRSSPALASLLQAHGVDPDEFIIGAWLNRQLSQHSFPKSSGDKAASMLVKWVELRWQAAGKDSATSCWKDKEEPFYPLEGIMEFLGKDSQVTDETKGRIARFLANQGCELHPPEHWLNRMTKGSGKWLIPIAERGLNAKTNRAKTRASKILTEAGIAHPEPELKKDPLFRVTVNGQPWPTNEFGRAEPGMSTDGRAFSLTRLADGLFSAPADSFLEGAEATRLEVYALPGFATPCAPSGAWLRAEVPLPVRFGEVTVVNAKLFGVSIEPKLPKGRNTPARLIEIDFGRVDEGYSPRGNCYHLENAGRLTLPRVSPGDYWLRVRHPGTTLMPWQKVTISKDGELFEPELKSGTTLVVPYHRPGGNGFRELPELRKDGKKFSDFGPPPAAATGKFPNSAIFANLAPGDYEVVTPEVKGRTLDTNAGFLIPSVTVKVKISEDDPVYLLSEPLVIRPQAASEAAPKGQ